MAKRSKTRAAAVRRRQEVTGARPEPAVAPVDLHEEYRYVIADLKRFGILAASMFVLLIVLALVL